MPEIWYTARAKWEQYRHWAQLPHLAGLLTLDIVLCPEIIRELGPEDWQHNVQQDYRLFYHPRLRQAQPAALS